MNSRYSRYLKAAHQYLVFFLLIGFIITCCMMLFLQTLSRAAGLELTPENIGTAAKLTFLNVLLLTAILTAIDGIRRKWMVERPARLIVQAAQKIAQGDYSVRIPQTLVLDSQDHFREIIDCFNRMAEALSRSGELHSDFIHNVSHELKTPLAVMGNYATLLQTPDLPESTRQEYARGIASACRRMADMVTNILRLNKLEAQDHLPDTRRFDLGEQLCECILQFESAWEEKSLEIETEIEDGLFVRSDPDMLSLVWNNLLSNAIKFTPDHGTIRIHLRRLGDIAEVQICDSGCGITAEVGARMFEKFYQGDTSHAVQGNGLGLALVKRIVEVTRSEMDVHSQPGHGTTFIIRLPVRDA